MAFFDKVNKMAKNLGEMAEGAMENGKLNMKIMEEKAGMAEAYAQLGEVVYNQYKSGVDQSARIMELINKIDGHQAAINAAQAPAPQPAPVQPAPAYAPPVQQAAAEEPVPVMDPVPEAPVEVVCEEEPVAEVICEEAAPEAEVQAEPAPVEASAPEPAPVPEPAPAPPAGPKFCGGCGSRLDVGARFCGNCGTPVA